MKIINSIWFLLSIIPYIEGRRDETCAKSDEKCMNYHYCPKYIRDWVNMKNRPDHITQQLYQARCGKMSLKKLCCPMPECYTWDGRPGTCSLSSDPNTTDRQRIISKCKDNRACNSELQVRQKGDCETEVSAFLPYPSLGCCGIQRVAENKISGGRAMTLDEFPWLAVIKYPKDKKNCTGALISGRYVLTAAHCVHKTSTQPYAVVLGEHDKSSTYDCDQTLECRGNTELTIEIEEIIAHPGFNPSSYLFRHDIALIRLKNMAAYSDFVQPICLPSSDVTKNPPQNFKLWTAGWGHTNGTYRSPSDVKLKVDLPYVDPYVCQRTFPRLWTYQMCAGGDGLKDSCGGDSGSPLVYNRNGIYEAIGIVSFSTEECGHPNTPSINTKIFHYVPWIHSNIRP